MNEAHRFLYMNEYSNIKFEQKLNIEFVFFTLLVSKEDKSNELILVF